MEFNIQHDIVAALKFNNTVSKAVFSDKSTFVYDLKKMITFFLALVLLLLVWNPTNGSLPCKLHPAACWHVASLTALPNLLMMTRNNIWNWSTRWKLRAIGNKICVFFYCTLSTFFWPTTMNNVSPIKSVNFEGIPPNVSAYFFVRIWKDH